MSATQSKIIFPLQDVFAELLLRTYSFMINVLQIASPACTELEVVTMNWLGKLLGLPEEFLNCSAGPGGGIIQVSVYRCSYTYKYYNIYYLPKVIIKYCNSYIV